MDFADIYKSKLRSAEDAAAAVPSDSKMAMGMATAEPPALLKALAERARSGGVEALKLCYFEATSIAGDTVLAYDLVDRIETYCMFVTRADPQHGQARPGRRPQGAALRAQHRGPVTTPRIDTHWIVTGHGRANMKGLSSTERARALIGLAHPNFRDGLTEAAKTQHLI